MLNKFAEILLDKKGEKLVSTRCNTDWFNKYHPELLTIVNSSDFDSSHDFITRLKSLTFGIQHVGCKICTKPVQWTRDTNSWKQTCSSECNSKYMQIKTTESALHRDEITAKIKRASTMKEKFGVEYSFQRPEVKEKLSRPKVSSYVEEKLKSNWLLEQYLTNNRTLVDIAKELNIHHSTVAYYLNNIKK